MRRSLATTSVSLCALLVSSSLLAGPAKPTPVVGRAVRTGISQKVSALPPAQPFAGKGEREEREPPLFACLADVAGAGAARRERGVELSRAGGVHPGEPSHTRVSSDQA